MEVYYYYVTCNNINAITYNNYKPINFIDMKFTTRGAAKKQTNLSYLGGVNVSQKIIKSQKIDNVMTYCLYLSPAKTSGYQVCPFSTPECRKGCLATSGRAKMELRGGIDKIKNARILKTRLFFEQRDFFMDWLIAEIKAQFNLATKKNMGFVVRLNGTSDIDWQNIIHNGKNIFEHFPNIQFYDYTKEYGKFKNIPQNYHLTLSYTGRNWDDCVKVLNNCGNVAMVFNIPDNKPLPTTFAGYDIIDGDITDMRVKDARGIIVGLHWKNIADKDINIEIKESIFAIQQDNITCDW